MEVLREAEALMLVNVAAHLLAAAVYGAMVYAAAAFVAWRLIGRRIGE